MSDLQANDKHRREARRFVDALATRLTELEHMAKDAKRHEAFQPEDYARFRSLFDHFRKLSEEFQILSHLTENSLAKFEVNDQRGNTEYRNLEAYFWRLQVPMLHSMIATNLRMLRVWDDRLRRGQGLPIGSRELFIETIRLIYDARLQLLRPRYVDLLDDEALKDAERANRILKALINKAPRLFDFGEDGERPTKPAEDSSR
ncbi:MAG TPA: hypothetical protein HPQ04_12935 [Rhodospirillaceae bacterium]|nr:hypothetical protein [Rhodospirillaceae bacterium]